MQRVVEVCAHDVVQKLVDEHEKMEDDHAVDNEEDFEMHKILVR